MWVVSESSLDHLQPEMVEAIEALRVSPSEGNIIRDEDIAGELFRSPADDECTIGRFEVRKTNNHRSTDNATEVPAAFHFPFDKTTKRHTSLWTTR